MWLNSERALFTPLAMLLVTACATGPQENAQFAGDMERTAMLDHPPVLAVAEVTVTDRSWIANYQAQVADVIHRHGGQIIARNQSLDRIEGGTAPPHGAVVLQFPSREHFDAFYNDPDYVPLREARLKGSRSQFSVIEAFDQHASRATTDEE